MKYYLLFYIKYWVFIFFYSHAPIVLYCIVYLAGQTVQTRTDRTARQERFRPAPVFYCVNVSSERVTLKLAGAVRSYSHHNKRTRHSTSYSWLPFKCSLGRWPRSGLVLLSCSCWPLLSKKYSGQGGHSRRSPPRFRHSSVLGSCFPQQT